MIKLFFNTIRNAFGVFGVIGLSLYYMFSLALLIGWFFNLHYLIKQFLATGTAEFTWLFVGQILGLFAYPIGGILGWFVFLQ